MDSLLSEFLKLEKNGGFHDSIDDVQKLQDMLIEARGHITADPGSAPVTLAKLQNPVKQGFESLNGDLKKMHKSLTDYSKALDKRFKDKPLPVVKNQVALDHVLINRAIGMHLLREGDFSVARAFQQDISQSPCGTDQVLSEELLEAFTEMYFILGEMKQRNLEPAVLWARKNGAALEARGSNLQFEIGRLQFVWLFLFDLPQSLGDALLYARREFGGFQARYLHEIQHLAAAMAYSTNLTDSPYKRIFYSEGAWEELGHSFTREFCSLLGLSADSPLYIAVTAGAIALPTLQKLQLIMEKKRTEWTTENELPVEIPLPRGYRFHSIFVCPVSKEQTTDQNPPMMMPCGHVVAKESLYMISRATKFKCPYCPGESKPSDARKVIL